MTAIPRLTFRQWSLLVSLGAPGIEIIRARRVARTAIVAVQRAVLRDAVLHGTGYYRSHMNMGGGCTPIRRVDPMDFHAAPPDARQ